MRRARHPRTWTGSEVTALVVVAVIVVVGALVLFSTGFDYFHIGHSGSVFVHDGFSDLHLACGTNAQVPSS